MKTNAKWITKNGKTKSSHVDIGCNIATKQVYKNVKKKLSVRVIFQLICAQKPYAMRMDHTLLAQ